MKQRLGKPAEERWSVRSERVRQDARERGDDDARDRAGGGSPLRAPEHHPPHLQRRADRQDLRVRGLRARRPRRIWRSAVPPRAACPAATEQGPEKAVNGSVAGGRGRLLVLRTTGRCSCRWTSARRAPVKRFVVKHASAGGEDEDADTREFNIQVSGEGKTFTTVETSSGAGFVEERTEYRQITLLRRAAGRPPHCSSTASWSRSTSAAC
ncbi:MAG: hypothetical protein MZV65_53235 [Chromatiales bacterium]|nr:hypothetical protein [Chromatiales bacterium]